MEQMRNTKWVLVENPERKSGLGRRWHKWEYWKTRDGTEYTGFSWLMTGTSTDIL
jgi:hypothetical protein